MSDDKERLRLMMVQSAQDIQALSYDLENTVTSTDVYFDKVLQIRNLAIELEAFIGLQPPRMRVFEQ